MTPPLEILESVWRERSTGRLWKTVALIDEPAIIIEPITPLLLTPSHHRQTHVLGSRNLRERFQELRPVGDKEA